MSSSTTGAGSRDCYIVFDLSFDALTHWQDILGGFCLDKDAPVPSSMPVPGVHAGKRWYLVFGDAVPSVPPVPHFLYFSAAAVLRLHAFKGFRSDGPGMFVASTLDLTDLCGRVCRIRVNNLNFQTPSHVTPEPSHGDEGDDGAARPRKKASAGRPRVPKAERTEEQVRVCLRQGLRPYVLTRSGDASPAGAS